MSRERGDRPRLVRGKVWASGARRRVLSGGRETPPTYGEPLSQGRRDHGLRFPSWPLSDRSSPSRYQPERPSPRFGGRWMGRCLIAQLYVALRTIGRRSFDGRLTSPKGYTALWDMEYTPSRIPMLHSLGAPIFSQRSFQGECYRRSRAPVFCRRVPIRSLRRRLKIRVPIPGTEQQSWGPAVVR